MKLRIAIIAVMVFVAAGLYLYLRQSPVEKGQPRETPSSVGDAGETPRFHRGEANTVEGSASGESVVPDDFDNSDFDDIPTQQEPKSPKRVLPVYFPTIVVALEKQLTPALPPAASVETERRHES